MILVFLAQFIVRFLKYPRNYALIEEGIAISDPPPP